jgi:LytS/YehU family sensor histidine kinase
MGVAGPGRRFVHSGHDVADLRSGDSAGCVAILGEPEPLERVVASDDRRCLARAVGGARRDRTQKDAFARDQELAFALERSELERQALDARLHVLQAQVAPHFLFNTLANVQALVDAGSPHASAVLRSLTAYLRAAVPLLDESSVTMEREVQLVRPYLELMQMRMPDRLQYSIDIDPSALKVRCPPTTLLTLVENAVRHGIDPSEEGGRIDVEIARCGERCVVRVTDTGVGLHEAANGLGTGLATLRERLQLIFGDAAHLRLTDNAPGGVIVEVDMPAHT